MDKKLFKSIAALLGIAALLALAVLEIHTVVRIIGLLAKVLTPALIGLLIALILDRPTNWFRKQYLKLFKNNRKKNGLSTGFAVASSYLAVSAFITLFLVIVAPRIITSINELLSNTDLYLDKVESAINNFIAGTDALKDKIAPVDLSGLDDWVASIAQKVADLAKTRLPEVIHFASELVEGIVAAVVGLIISVYVLLSRNKLKWQSKKTVYALFPEKVAKFLRDAARLTANTFSNYISGRILDSVIVGILCFIGMTIIGLSHAALISFMVGVTNFIPMIGPALGIIPSALILLLVSPVECFWFLIFIALLMFLDSNLIDLRISGNATGLPPLFVLIAVIGGGSLFGFVGFVLTVPAGAVAYTLFKRWVVHRSKKKNIPLDDEPYTDPPKDKLQNKLYKRIPEEEEK